MTATPAHRSALLQASIKLAERSIHFTALSKLQGDIAWGERLYARAVRCQRGAFRLQRWAMGAT